MRCFMFSGTCLCDPPSSIHPNTGSSQKQSWWEQFEGKSGTRLQFSPPQPPLCSPIKLMLDGHQGEG
ncbi:hypothetical protein OJAV_G00073780 [Oryzias javanicus]|uniref:Uncharacterized protein n=1 Tax=Oryzias javanicus TaxID=123683 RepID=A0A3S2MKL3_ORYJA|nr:hypothetical protein OJAV_G00073780 [Oryzias javanicus]